jgi:hypothetical protein
MRSSEGVNVCKGRARDFDALMHLSVRGVDAEQCAGDGGIVGVIGSMFSYRVESHLKVSGCGVLDLFMGQFFAQRAGTPDSCCFWRTGRRDSRFRSGLYPRTCTLPPQLERHEHHGAAENPL